jgi:periplasmic protein TonB
MRIIVCSLFALFITQCVFSQDTSRLIRDDDAIFTKTEKDAEFVGGDGAWKHYLTTNLNSNIPIIHGAPGGTYLVRVRFIVRKDGSISDVQAETKCGYGMEEEVIRIIKNSPKWTPAYQNNRPVNAYRRMPVTFVVQSQ